MRCLMKKISSRTPVYRAEGAKAATGRYPVFAVGLVLAILPLLFVSYTPAYASFHVPEYQAEYGYVADYADVL